MKFPTENEMAHAENTRNKLVRLPEEVEKKIMDTLSKVEWNATFDLSGPSKFDKMSLEELKDYLAKGYLKDNLHKIEALN